MTIRTRFAPSPTGYLHVGGARTALFSWLHARHNKGVFALRIEDTDRERSTPESVQAILDGLSWMGIDYDEGPVYQSQRDDIYAEVIARLLDEGHAYRCYCSRDELDAMREEQRANKQKPRYDGRCRRREAVPDGVEPVIRFRNPDDGEVHWVDAVKGDIRISNSELDDLIIARSDGSPTYNLVVVVDDIAMHLTHVIRGDDHVNNTPRQINIMRALGHTPPVYAHVPMILGADGKRLSKRHGAVSVLQYREDGILAEALLNYLARLGWSHGDQEIFSVEELQDVFDLGSIQKAAASFDPEKLLWLNQHYLKTLPAADVANRLWPFLRSLLGTDDELDEAAQQRLSGIVEAQRERSKTLVDMAERSRFFFEAPDAYDEKAARKNLTAEAVEVIAELVEAFSALDDWADEPIHDVVVAISARRDVKMGKVAQPIRVAVTGTTVSPPIDQTLRLLGREATVARLKTASEWIVEQSA